jgi:hypothetical protein
MWVESLQKNLCRILLSALEGKKKQNCHKPNNHNKCTSHNTTNLHNHNKEVPQLIRQKFSKQELTTAFQSTASIQMLRHKWKTGTQLQQIMAKQCSKINLSVRNMLVRFNKIFLIKVSGIAPICKLLSEKFSGVRTLLHTMKRYAPQITTDDEPLTTSQRLAEFLQKENRDFDCTKIILNNNLVSSRGIFYGC